MTVKLGSIVTVLIKPHDAADSGNAVGVITRVHSYGTVPVAGPSPRSVAVAVVNYRLISDDDDEQGRRVTSAQVFASRDDANAFIAAGIKAGVDAAIAQGQELTAVVDGRHNGMVAYETH